MKFYLLSIYTIIFIGFLPLFSAENIIEKEERTIRFFNIMAKLPQEITLKFINNYSPELQNYKIADEIKNSLYLDGNLNPQYEEFAIKYTDELTRSIIISEMNCEGKKFVDYINEQFEEYTHNGSSFEIINSLKRPFVPLPYYIRYDYKQNFVLRNIRLQRDFYQNFTTTLSQDAICWDKMQMEINVHANKRTIKKHSDQIYNTILSMIRDSVPVFEYLRIHHNDMQPLKKGNELLDRDSDKTFLAFLKNKLYQHRFIVRDQCNKRNIKLTNTCGDELGILW